MRQEMLVVGVAWVIDPFSSSFIGESQKLMI